MHVLRVAQTVYPETTGGGAYHVHALSRDQAAAGHDVTVLTTRTGPDQPQLDHRDGYTLVRFDPVAAPLGNALCPGLARYLHAARDVDVVHAHSHLYASTNLAALHRELGRLPGVERPPLAITNHGLYSQTAPEWVFDLYLRTLGRATFNRADLVFCYTGTDRDRLRDVGVSTPVAVVPNGIDTTRFRPDGPESERLDDGDPAVLFVGRLVEGKRPGDAVTAVEQLRETLPGARLYLCGDGPRRTGLEAQTGEAVTMLGRQPYDEMPALYRAADALVLPSRAEGTPRTVLEALACGTPVACSALSHLRDAFDDAPCYFPVGDTDRIRDCLAAICNSDDTPNGSASVRSVRGSSDLPVTDWSETVRRTSDRLAGLVG